MMCVSVTNKELDRTERKKVLKQLFSKSILADYKWYAFPISQIKRLQRHPWAYKLMWLFERCLFRVEKRKNKKAAAIRYE